MNKIQTSQLSIVLWIAVPIVILTVFLAVELKLSLFYSIVLGIDVIICCICLLYITVQGLAPSITGGSERNPASEAFLVVLFISVLAGHEIFVSAIRDAETQQRSFAIFMEIFVAKVLTYGVALIGGAFLGYFAGKRVYQRKLRRRTEFLKKSSGSLTERVGSEFEVGFLVFLLSACLWGAIIGLVTRFMPIIGPWLQRMDGL
jgi:hypothetical protein